MQATDTQTALQALRLIGWCKNIDRDCISRFSETLFPRALLRALTLRGLLSPYHETYGRRLTPAGCRYLQEHGYPMARDQHTQRVGRRFENADVTVTMAAARISPYLEAVPDLRQSPGYLPACVLRARAGQHSLGSNQVTGFLRAGDTLYGVYYPRGDNHSLSPARELSCVEGVALACGCTQTRLIFAGRSYAGAYTALLGDAGEHEARPARRKKTSYARFYQDAALTCHLLPCSRTGVYQLRLLCLPDYRGRLARAITGKPLAEPALSACDLMLQGSDLPCVMLADMDLRRLSLAARQAADAGYARLGVVALPYQIRFLRCYFQDAFFHYYRIDEGTLDTVCKGVLPNEATV